MAEETNTECTAGFYTIKSRAYTEQDDELKLRNVQLDTIMKISQIIYAAFGYSEEIKVVDIDRSNVMAGIIYTTFQAIKWEKNSNLKDKNAYSALKVETNSVTKTIGEILRIIPESLINALNLRTCYPLITMMTNFKSSMDEIRLGTTVIPFSGKRPAGKNSAGGKNITRLGFNGAHRVLFGGLTYSSQRKLAMLESLGPLTLCVMLLNEKSHRSEIEKALLNTISVLPMAQQIVDLIKIGINTSYLFSVLGNLLLLTSDNTIRSHYYPFEFYMHLDRFLLKTNKDASRWRVFSFHGVKSMQCYHQIFAMNEVKIRVKTGASIDIAKQVIFHSMFDRGNEDLGIYPQITNHMTWKTRSDVNNFFIKRSEKGQVEFDAIKYTAISGSPIFIKKDCSVELTELLRVSSFGFDVDLLVAAMKQMIKDELNSIKQMIKDQLNSIDREYVGTSYWMRFNEETKQWDTDKAFGVTESGKYFWAASM